MGEGWSMTWSIPFYMIMMEGGWHVGLIMQGVWDVGLMMEGGWM